MLLQLRPLKDVLPSLLCFDLSTDKDQLICHSCEQERFAAALALLCWRLPGQDLRQRRPPAAADAASVGPAALALQRGLKFSKSYLVCVFVPFDEPNFINL